MSFWNGWTANNYEAKYNFSFYKWKDTKPYFKVTQFYPLKEEKWIADFVVGKLKGVFFREDVMIEGAKNPFDEVKVVLDDGENQYNISARLDNVSRFLVNQLLTANVWEEIKISTYVNSKGYKTLIATRVGEKVNIKGKNWKDITVDKSLDLWVDMSEFPEIDITKDKKWNVVSVDDSDANKFIIRKAKERFNLVADRIDSPNEELTMEDIPF